MAKTELKVTIEQLEKILEYAKNRAKYGSMRECFLISMTENEITFEQPCHYAECNSIYHRIKRDK